MQSPMHACFMGGGAADGDGACTARPAAQAEARILIPAAEPVITTSLYATHMGYASFTWSRAAFGLSLRVEIQLPSAAPPPTTSSATSSFSSSNASSTSTVSDCGSDLATIQFQIRPSFLWKRSGVKRLRVKEESQEDGQRQRRTVDVSWDLTGAAFRGHGGGPEPSSGYFVSVTVDRELFVIIGDVKSAEAFKAKREAPADYCIVGKLCLKGEPRNPVLISRKEHVVLRASAETSRAMPYATRVPVGGTDREVALELQGRNGEKEARMSLVVDRKKVLRVKRLRWKFRGNERVPVDDNFGVQVSWDAHSWLFPRRAEAYDDAAVQAHASISAPAAAKSELGHMVFVLRFDGNVTDERKDGFVDRLSSGEGDGEVRNARTAGLGKTTQSSSLSSPPPSSPSVMDWASVEENQLMGGSHGFSLVVYVWRR